MAATFSGKLRVEYYSMAASSVMATAAKTIFLVDNQSMVDLTNRTGAVEQEAAAAKELAAAADTNATEAKSKADILMEKVEALRARADGLPPGFAGLLSARRRCARCDGKQL